MILLRQCRGLYERMKVRQKVSAWSKPSNRSANTGKVRDRLLVALDKGVVVRRPRASELDKPSSLMSWATEPAAVGAPRSEWMVSDSGTIPS